MNNKELYDALSGIDQGYIERSDDLDGMRSEFAKEKSCRIRMITSACGGAFAAVFAVVLGGTVLLGNSPKPDEMFSGAEIIDASAASTEAVTENTSASEERAVTTKKVIADAPQLASTESTSADIEDITDSIAEVTDEYSADADDPTESGNSPDVPTKNPAENTENLPSDQFPIEGDNLGDPGDDPPLVLTQVRSADGIWMNGCDYLECGHSTSNYTQGEFLGYGSSFSPLPKYWESFYTDWYSSTLETAEIYSVNEDSSHIMMKFDGAWYMLEKS